MDTSCLTNARLVWSHPNAGILRWLSLWSQIKSTIISFIILFQSTISCAISKHHSGFCWSAVWFVQEQMPSLKVTQSSHARTWISTSDLPFPSSSLLKVTKWSPVIAYGTSCKLDLISANVSLCWVSTLACSRLATVLIIFIHVQEID